MLSGGLLSSILRDHLAGGGRDPRHALRKELVEDGMPLQCAQAQQKALVSHPSKARGIIAFQNHRLQELQHGQSGCMSAADVHAAKQGFTQEYRALGADDRARWENKAYYCALNNVSAPGDDPEPIQTASLAKVNFGIGESDLPISESTASRILESQIGKKPGGFTSYREKLQSDFRKSLFVRDAGHPTHRISKP